MDEPDRVDERITMYDGETIDLYKHTKKIVSFHKIHDFKIEKWFLTYKGQEEEPMGDYEKVTNMSVDEGRKLWSTMFKRDWKRSTEEEIQEAETASTFPYLNSISESISSQGSLLVDGAEADQIVLNNHYNLPTLAMSNMHLSPQIAEDGTVEITNSNGVIETANIIKMNKEIHMLKQKIKSLEEKE